MNKPKSSHILELAQNTIFVDRDSAKDLMVLAFKTEDAIHALDKLLPKVPEPMSNEEYKDLSEYQVAKIIAIANELNRREKQHIATKILTKIEAHEKLKTRRKRKAN